VRSGKKGLFSAALVSVRLIYRAPVHPLQLKRGRLKGRKGVSGLRRIPSILQARKARGRGTGRKKGFRWKASGRVLICMRVSFLERHSSPSSSNGAANVDAAAANAPASAAAAECERAGAAA